MCISAYSFIIVLSLLLPCIIILFLHLLSTNHKCTQPCYFPPATQTCCSEGEDGLEFFNEEFYATCYPDYRSCGVMEPSAVPFR
jgi:hypothetical protein